MKKLALLSLVFATFTGAAHASSCSVDLAKKYVMGLEAVASGVTNVDPGYKANGKTLVDADEMSVAGDNAFIVTITNDESYYGGSYSKYLVVLKQTSRGVCMPSSITLVGNTTTK